MKVYENYLITFEGIDLEQEYFSKTKTNFWLDYFRPKLIVYNHLQGIHPLGLSLESSKLSYSEVPNEYYVCGEILDYEVDEKGIRAKYIIYDKLPDTLTSVLEFWDEAVQKEHSEWLELVRKYQEEGILAFSTDTLRQLATRKSTETPRTLISSWPIAYASLTHIAAEPRNSRNFQNLEELSNEGVLQRKSVAEDESISDIQKALNTISYNGVTCQATDRRTADSANKKYERTVRYNGKEATVSYGDPDMRMRTTNSDARENFQSRHNCNEKKDPFSPGFWACYDWRDTKFNSISGDVEMNDVVENNEEKIYEEPDVQKMESPNDMSGIVEMLREVLAMLRSDTSKAGDAVEAEEEAVAESDTTEGVGKNSTTVKVQVPMGASKYAAQTPVAKNVNVNVLGGQKDDDPYRFTKSLRLMRDKPANYQKDLKALGLVPGSSGGFTTQIQQSNELIDMLMERSIFMRGGEAGRLVDYMPMASDTMTIPVLASGGTAYWVGENNTITSSQPTFEQRSLVAKKLAMLIPISNELLADNSVQLETKLRENMVQIMRNSLDRAILFGVGTAAQPLGVRNTPGVTLTALNAAPTYDNLVDAIQRLENANVELDETTAWVFNPREKATFRKLEDGAGNLIWTDSTAVSQTAGASANGSLVGYPWIASSNIIPGQGSNTTTENDIYFGVWRGVIVGLRNDIEITASSEAGTAFQDDQTWIKAVMRVDVAMKHPEMIQVLTDVQV